MKFGEYYSLARIIKATHLEFIVFPNGFVVLTKDRKDYKYKIILDKEMFPICCCWWFVHRSMNNRAKFGLCVHQLGFLYTFNKPLFWKQFDKK